MTQTKISAFAHELSKTASPGLGTLLGQNVTKTVKVKAKKALRKTAGPRMAALMDMARSALAKVKGHGARAAESLSAKGGRAMDAARGNAAVGKAIDFAKRNPTAAMAIAGAGAGGIAGGEDNRLKGALIGAGLAAGGGHAGRKAGHYLGARKGLSSAKLTARELINNPKKVQDWARRGMIGGAAAGGLGGGLMMRDGEKTAGRSIVNGPAMGAGKGLVPVKKKVR